MDPKGYKYVYTKEKYDEYKKLSTQQKLEWLEKMSRFLYGLMTPKDREITDKFRHGNLRTN